MEKEHLVHIEGEPQSNELRRRAVNLIARGHKTYTPTQPVISKAEGVYIWTVDGAKLLDFTSGVLVANLGHNNDYFEERFRAYREGTPRNAYDTFTPLEVEAAERLIDHLDSPKLQRIIWAATGSEGIIKAMWCAQHRYSDRPTMVATRGGFHGKKGLAGDVTGETSDNPNVRFISFPMCDNCQEVEGAEKGQEEICRSKYEEELANLQREFPGKICLLVTEPYLGAKGSFHPPSWYLQLLNRWCEENDVPLILDEVQSCMGRTGEMYAFKKHGLDPDIVILGKGIGNGEPGSVVVGRDDLLQSLDYGEGSDTFSGNPRACAALLAALDTFEEFPILDNCRATSQVIAKGLNELRDEFSFVRFVRGEGLVWGLELANGDLANEAVMRCYLQYTSGGLGLHLMGPLAGKVLRISPPLVMEPEQARTGIELMRRAFAEMRSRHR
jgi:4-aminobutyrate aminotransferase-like enzyme